MCGYKEIGLTSIRSAREPISNVISPIKKEWGKISAKCCSRHLVKPDVPVKYTDQNGEIVEE